MTKPKPGAKRSIVYVQEGKCPRGGKHTEGVRAVRGGALLYCLKCLKSSAQIDQELNGPSGDRWAR